MVRTIFGAVTRRRVCFENICIVGLLFRIYLQNRSFTHSGTLKFQVFTNTGNNAAASNGPNETHGQTPKHRYVEDNANSIYDGAIDEHKSSNRNSRTKPEVKTSRPTPKFQVHKSTRRSHQDNASVATHSENEAQNKTSDLRRVPSAARPVPVKMLRRRDETRLNKSEFLR